MFELLKTGGLTIVMLLIVSIISLGFIIERFIALGYEQRRISFFKRFLSRKSFSESDLLAKADKEKSAIAVIIKNIFSNVNLSKDENIHITRSLLRHEMSVMEKGLEVVEIAASISPLLGLLGTVIGMIEAFSAITKSGIGNPAVFSQSISKALITTVVGLIVAIPSYAFYLYFSKKVEDMIVEIDKYAVILITKIYRKKENV